MKKVIALVTVFCFLTMGCAGTITTTKTTTNYGYQMRDADNGATATEGKDETSSTSTDDTGGTGIVKTQGKVKSEGVGPVGKVVTEEKRPQKFYESPWFWVGVGVVVIGGAIVVVYFLSGPAVSVTAAGVTVP